MNLSRNCDKLSRMRSENNAYLELLRPFAMEPHKASIDVIVNGFRNDGYAPAALLGSFNSEMHALSNMCGGKPFEASSRFYRAEDGKMHMTMPFDAFTNMLSAYSDAIEQRTQSAAPKQGIAELPIADEIVRSFYIKKHATVEIPWPSLAYYKPGEAETIATNADRALREKALPAFQQSWQPKITANEKTHHFSMHPVVLAELLRDVSPALLRPDSPFKVVPIVEFLKGFNYLHNVTASTPLTSAPEAVETTAGDGVDRSFAARRKAQLEAGGGGVQIGGGTITPIRRNLTPEKDDGSGGEQS